MQGRCMILRHFPAENAEGLEQLRRGGVYDPPLDSERMETYTQALTDPILTHLQPGPRTILVGPKIRTRQTAQVIWLALELKNWFAGGPWRLPLLDDFNSRNWGSYKEIMARLTGTGGKNMEEQFLKALDADVAASQSLLNQAQQILDSLEGNTLYVTHGEIKAAVEIALVGGRFQEHSSPNGSFTVIRDGQIESLNETSHLPS